MDDLTVIYLTANVISSFFMTNMQAHLIEAIGDTKIVTVSKKPIEFGDVRLIFADSPRSHLNIYWMALQGVKHAKTKYIAIAEDDTLYHAKHFQFRPKDGHFGYNRACWSIYTWSKPPIFSYTGRQNHCVLICERDLYIEAIEERFAKYPDHSKVNLALWAEPGKYESQLGVTERDVQIFYSDPACIMFSHPQGLSHKHLGERKRLAPIRAYEIPHWGRAEEIVKLYA